MVELLLGTLRQVPLREVWSSESSDFTPWLAQEENLKRLGDVLRLELALEATEQQIGPFRADIVCKDTVDGSFVLIENQLERTDHSHLGQLLTYAAGLSTVTIVWIAERFTNEHRAALDWLNVVTAPDIGFFGLEIELWRIGDSAVAPKFNVVCQPNDWVKSLTRAREEGSFTEVERLRLEFWTAFGEYLQQRNSFLKPRKPSNKMWTSFSLGRTGFHVSALAAMSDKFIAVQFVIKAPEAKELFGALERDKIAIETEIGTPLLWRELPNRMRSDVRLNRNDIDPTDKAQWNACFEWLRQYVEAFHRAFSSRVRTLQPLALDDESEA